MLFYYAIIAVPRTESADRRKKIVEAIQRIDRRREQRDQLSSLPFAVTPEQNARRGIQFEEPRVEQRHGLICDRKDPAERNLNQGNIGGSHGWAGIE